MLQLVKGYLDTDYDYPATVEGIAKDIAAASQEILEGLEGEAREEMERVNAINLKMAPLTPDHHFYIDQGANAHVRLVLIAIGKKLVEKGLLDDANDIIFLRYNEMRAYLGSAESVPARDLIAARKTEREQQQKLWPPDWIGTATKNQLTFPYLNLWGFPDKFYRDPSSQAHVIKGIGGSAGVIDGVARLVQTVDEFDEVMAGDILVCQMTNPAWVVLFTKIAGLVTDAGGTVSHPAVLAREFEIPAVVGASVATQRIKTGDRVRVDGTTGEVHLLDVEAPEPASSGPSWGDIDRG